MDDVLQYNAHIIESKKMALCMKELKNLLKCSSCDKLSKSTRRIYFNLLIDRDVYDHYFFNDTCYRCMINGAFAIDFLEWFKIDSVDNFISLYPVIKKVYDENQGVVNVLLHPINASDGDTSSSPNPNTSQTLTH